MKNGMLRHIVHRSSTSWLLFSWLMLLDVRSKSNALSSSQIWRQLWDRSYPVIRWHWSRSQSYGTLRVTQCDSSDDSEIIAYYMGRFMNVYYNFQKKFNNPDWINDSLLEWNFSIIEQGFFYFILQGWSLLYKHENSLFLSKSGKICKIRFHEWWCNLLQKCTWIC